MSRQLARGDHRGLRRGPVADREAGTTQLQGLAEPSDPLRDVLARVGGEELGVAERDLQVVKPPADERLQRDGVDVLRLDPLEQLIVERQRLVARQPEQDLAEALVLVAA